MGKTITTYVFLVLSVGVFALLSFRLYEKNESVHFVSNTEKEVIKKLTTIREIEEAFKGVHGRYTANWDSLKTFVESGDIYIIERKEEIIVREFGGDSIIVHLDTLNAVPVKDSLFTPRAFKALDLANLEKAPVTGKPFEIAVGTIRNGKVNVIEVVDPDPVNPDRKGDGPLSPLKFGSISEATTAGNWEK